MAGNVAEFFWAIIGDANPEPVAVCIEDGKRVAYTIGCPDPFDLDSGNIELISPGVWWRYSDKKGRKEAYVAEPSPMKVPEKVRLPELERERDVAEKRLAADKKRGIRHGWRRINP